MPALTAFTSARLSLLVRPFTDGTVIGGSFAAESFPTPGVVLDAVLDGTGCGFVTWIAGSVDVPTVWLSVGIVSEPGVGRASLPEAQANTPRSANAENLRTDAILIETYCISSTEELLIFEWEVSSYVIHNSGPKCFLPVPSSVLQP
ncbi:MAG TPA: hypothetical protein VK474_12790 [Chthoniobacterales bacterium]|nr:hypothetical protein [Chthoniobacterales bacterium]